MLRTPSEEEALARELAPSLGLTPFELATGYIAGPANGGRLPLPAVPESLSPLAAVEDAILPALQRGPCFVSFSGGRDSSTVLAAAVRVARKHGLPDPVPLTLVFPDAPKSEETAWQKRVVDWLSIGDWRRIEIGDELDYLGPAAQRVMLRHGVLFPFNTHFYVPLLEAAGGGTMFTGGGGDGLFDTWRWQDEMLLLTGRARPRVRQLPRLAYFAAPLPVRRFAAGWIGLSRRPWLTRRGQALLRRAIAREAEEPRRFDTRVPWFAGRRSIALTRRSAQLVAADFGVTVEHPLMEPRVLAALVREGGRAGPGLRTAAMRRFFGPLLPDDVLARRTKATFGEAVFTRYTREFLDGWDGRPILPGLVDPEGFLRAWHNEELNFPRMLLQATWLARARNAP